MKALLPLICIFCILVACGSTKDATMNKTPDKSTGEGKYMISAEIVEHEFESKNGKITGQKELYLRRSVQDYFIKFCESQVTEEEIRKELDKQTGQFKSLTLEVEFKNGMWDSCSDELVQSRTGEYVIIHRIVR